MAKKKVVIFGDSILKPIVVDNDTKKYVISNSIDWEEIEKTLNVKIENRSRMGATIRHGYADFKECIENSNDYQTIVFEFGGNDSDYFWKNVSLDKTITHLPKTDLDEFETILNEMLDLVLEKGIKPILMSLPPISSLRYYNWIVRTGLNEENIMHHLVDIETISRHQELYNNIIVKTAYARNIDLVDIRNEFLKRMDYMSLMCEDGIHPNTDGAKVIINSFIDKYKDRVV